MPVKQAVTSQSKRSNKTAQKRKYRQRATKNATQKKRKHRQRRSMKDLLDLIGFINSTQKDLQAIYRLTSLQINFVTKY